MIKKDIPINKRPIIQEMNARGKLKALVGKIRANCNYD